MLPSNSREDGLLVVRHHGPPLALPRATPPLAFYPSMLRGACWTGRLPRSWRCNHGPNERDKPVTCVFPVLLLRPKPGGVDNQDAVVGKPPAREAYEARAHILRQRRRAAHIEAQLGRGGQLVDILTTRA